MLAWPLVGRDRELNLITTAFGDRGTAGVVVVGHCGTGKTLLARHALTALAAENIPTSWVLATRSAAAVPFGVMAHLLPVGSRPDGEPFSVMCALTKRIVELGGPHRVAIGVDDAQFLDHASAATLAQLAQRSAVYLVITARAGRAIPDALAAMCKDGLLRRVELAPLPSANIDTLIDLTLDGPVAGLTRHRLRHECAGNPLALHEMLHCGLETGTLRRIHGLWWWHEEPHAREPVLGAALPDGLDAGAALVHELVALGGPVPLSLVEQLADQDGIEAAERGGLVRVVRSDNRILLRATDPLSSSTVRATLPVSRTRGRFRMLSAAALAMPMRRNGDALRAARWQLAGGASARPDVLLAGAREALRRFDFRLAERLALAGRDGAPGPDADQLLAEILVWRGRGADAALLLPVRPPEPALDRARWAVIRATALYSATGTTAGTDRALDATGGPAAVAARSWIRLLDRQCAQSLSIAQDAPADGALPAAGIAAAGLLGQRTEAARQLSIVDDEPLAALQLGFGRWLAEFSAGNLNAAWELADGGYHRAIRTGAPLAAGVWAAPRGLVAAAQGRIGTASESLREAFIVLSDGDPFRLLRCCLAGLALVAALAGEAAEAEDWMVRSDRIAGSANRLFEPQVELCRAWTQSAGGSVAEAVRTARRVAALARAEGIPSVEGCALYDVARLSGSTDLDRLAELAGTVETPLIPVLADAATGLSTVDNERAGELLADAASRFESLGHSLLAAEAGCAASRAFRRAGMHSSANVQLEKATAVRETCAGAHTPLLSHEDSVTLLTPREREVVLLAPTHTSRQIAGLLGLTVHTVDNYLARSYTKLNVSGRAGLRRLLGHS